MPSYGSVKGKTVVTLAEGKKIGVVEDLVLDSEQKVVRWLSLREGGLLHSKQIWAPVSEVHGWGGDAVVLKDEGAVLLGDDAPLGEGPSNANRKIVGAKVVTEQGEHIGVATNYDFDPQSFAVISVDVSSDRMFFAKTITIPGDQVLTIGADVLMVAHDAVTPPGEMDGPNMDNLAGPPITPD